MDAHDLKNLLDAVRSGTVSPEEAERKIRWPSPFEKVGEYATIDHHRRLRCGFPEVVFGQNKTAEHIEGILRVMIRQGEGCLVTRVAPDAAEHLKQAFPEGEHNAIGRTFRVRQNGSEPERLGVVRIVTGGTSDLPVAEEAKVTAEAWNCDVALISDVGVAGIHRLLGRLDELQGADVLVAVAGMEAALPSVLGGLTDCPIIGVPTSVGYGAHFGGLASLLGMLNSCSSNVVTVNIDAGFNGGHVAALIARRAALARLGRSPNEGISPKDEGSAAELPNEDRRARA
ncbi:nickel pincer cofactor biosynthesis protein LarB [Tautonia rosea]|uniref:nickel pincer cofactor biosynthesis protein LarB n=1 Tax=Tautonia rosea TaxID=2728037 RepID=UPI001474C23D|nr:nickel pincer cofactor biosynthesis protein LarB [Tautonia rosea]